MHHFINKKVLATTQSWFLGRDGRQYRAVHGTLKSINEAGKTLGFIPNRSHANWFIEIGDMVIMGCQILFIEAVDDVSTNMVTEEDKDGQMIERRTSIYITS